MENKITVTGTPHVGTRRTVSRTMVEVICALIPALACAIYFFGIRTAAVVAVTIIGAVVTEYLVTRYMLHRPTTIKDCSAILTGLLLGMSLPSGIPYPIAFIGGVVAIGIGKMAFGGLGQNIFNPAMVGRVFLLISFPAQMTTWPLPLHVDGATGATVLTAIEESGFDASGIDLLEMATGNMGGSLGEVGGFALLLGGIYLSIRRIIRPIIPLTIFATVALLSLAIGHHPLVELLSGGMILGAIFMATDYVTSPMTNKGLVVYAIGIGVITFVIRHWGSYPEGISFAILIMNGVTPLINRGFKPRIFGERSKK